MQERLQKVIMKKNFTLSLEYGNAVQARKESGNLSGLVNDLLASWLNKPKEERKKLRFLQEANEEIILARAELARLEREREKLLEEEKKSVIVRGE